MEAPAAVSYCCSRCGATAESRNKLFKHLKSCNPCKDDTSTQPHFPNIEDIRSEMGGYACYVTGGRHRGKTLGTVERFCWDKCIWEPCPSLIENRGSHGAVTVNNSIFVCGGGGFKSNLATCELFDTTTQHWSLMDPMKTYRHALAVAPLFSVFHIFNELEASPSKRQCSDSGEGISLPREACWGVCAVGGWVNGSVCSADLEIYDFATNKWFTAASMNQGRRLLGAAAFNGELFVFGGNCDDGVWYTAAAEKYSPLSNEWRSIKDLPSPGPTSAISVGGLIYVLMHGKRVVIYDPLEDMYSDRAPLPEPEWFSFSITSVGDFIFAHGGAIKGAWSKAFYVYHTKLDCWLKLPDMSTCRRRCAAAIV